MLRKRGRGFIVGLVLAVGMAWTLPFAASRGDDTPRDKQIADLEKQIQELNKKLGDLRTTPAATATAAPKTPSEGSVPSNWMKELNWRCIGPANMGGRITAISVFEADPSTYWVATASGGLVKTTNNGISFQHQFDHEATVSIGDVCVAPSDRNIVWVGTGEGNPRNSVSYGDGVYKSTDSGKTWKNMGLKKSYQIGRIAIHPKNPNVVYVGALGRCYGPNEERGLFKTTNGGDSWEKVLYADDRTGVIDMQMDPADPETLLVAMWDRQRDEFDDFLGEPPPPEGIERYDPVRKYGKSAGIYKTTDGGKTFRKLTQGLPTVAMGRIGLDYYRKNPKVVFAVIDTEKVGTGIAPLTFNFGAFGTDATGGAKVTVVNANSPAAAAGLKVDDVVVSVGDKPVPNYSGFIELLRPHKVGDKVKIAYQRGADKKDVEVTLAARPAPGGRGGAGGGGRGGPGGRGGFLNPGFSGEDAEGGLLVTDIVADGLAAKAGLKVDDVVSSIDGKPVENFFAMLRTIASSHQAGDTITLQVTRGAEKKEMKVALQAGGFGGRGGEPRPGGNRTPRPYSGGLGAQRENVQHEQGPDGFQTGGIYKSTDGGETWQRINSLNPRPMYFSQVRVDPSDENIVWVLGVSMYLSKDGGKTFAMAQNRGVHSDQHAMWVDPKDGRHMIVGCDGGFYQTYDRGERWDHLNHLALGQFYHVVVDTRPIYRAYGGLQDNGSWAGPTRTLRGSGPINEDWVSIGGGDGFVCGVDPNDADIVYSESQGGAIQRRNLRTGERASIRPLRVPGKPAHRFNWNTPFLLSKHNPLIFYCAGEYVYRSVKRGDNLRAISPEITRTKHGSATALGESPRNPELLYVGTDDGALWVTRDGGTNKWTRIDDKVGLPGPRWVASIEPSRYAEGRAYVAFDAHRSDDDEPYVFVTEDYGQTWKSIRANLPVGSTRVCREDIHNPDILYVGTEFAAWVSADRGNSWTKLNNNLPTVAVHEFAQHPTSGEIVAATHGRSLWVLDVTPLRQFNAETLKAKAHLYQPNTVVTYRPEGGREGPLSPSERKFSGGNPLPGALLYYSLTKKADSASLKIFDYTGKPVRELPIRPDQLEAGLHRMYWDLGQGTGRPGGRGGQGQGGGGGGGGRRGGQRMAGGGTPGQQPAAGGGQAAQAPPGGQQQAAPSEETQQEGAAGFGGGFGGFFGRGNQVNPGTYRVVLVVDGQELTQFVKIEGEGTRAGDVLATDEDDDDPR
jgi:photosystem II stability/assembly factor-like uncharacterized protein/membrane-associated protease RseP (regulator of RpoE activity)